jgi:hypothetical protein
MEFCQMKQLWAHTPSVGDPDTIDGVPKQE